MDPEFGKVIPLDCPTIGAPSGAIGNWGERFARNYLASKGVFTVRHAVFRLSQGRLISDLLHPESMTVYEVKTGRKPAEPYFRARLASYGVLLGENLAKKVTYVNVAFGNTGGFTESQTSAIRQYGFEMLAIKQ